jgi:SAM-dependent methyltransferase
MRLFTRLHVAADQKNREDILGLLEPAPEAKILEVGPGSGLDCVKAGLTIGTSRLYGLEFFGMGEIARKNGLEIRECDLTRTWPCNDGEFDVVLSNQVLEHIPNTDHFFEEIYRVLKPGAYAVVSTPNLGSWVHIIMLIFTFHPVHCWVSDRLCALGNPISSLRGTIRKVPTSAHLRLFTPRALREMAEAYRFSAEKLLCGSYGLSVLDRILCRLNPYHGIYATIKMRKPYEK